MVTGRAGSAVVVVMAVGEVVLFWALEELLLLLAQVLWVSVLLRGIGLQSGWCCGSRSMHQTRCLAVVGFLLACARAHTLARGHHAHCRSLCMCTRT